jgi:methionyl-tRNA formyltransferase
LAQVRAFEGWPGTRGSFRVGADGEAVLLKVLRARLEPPSPDDAASPDQVRLVAGALRVVCDDGSVLAVTEVQPPGGRAMAASAYAAGLRGRPLLRDPPPP